MSDEKNPSLGLSDIVANIWPERTQMAEQERDEARDEAERLRSNLKNVSRCLAKEMAQVDRLSWFVNHVIACDDGDNCRGITGWRIRSDLVGKVVMFGPTINDAIDAERKKK